MLLRKLTLLSMASSSAILVLLLCFNAVVVDVRADDGSSSEWEPEDRDVQFQVDSDQVQIQGSGVAVGEEADRLQFQIHLKDDDNNLFETQFQWSKNHDGGGDGGSGSGNDSLAVNGTDGGGGGEGDEQSLSFDFRLSYIVEYIESGVTAGFQIDEDAVVSTYGGDEFNNRKKKSPVNMSLLKKKKASSSTRAALIPNTQAQWDDATRLADQTSGTATIYSFSASTSDGVLTIKGYVSTAAATTSNGVVLNPNTIKLDINIKDYPFSDQTNSSYLALVGRVKAEVDSNVEQSEGSDDDSVALSAPNATIATGGFAWANQVVVDGSAAAVVSNTLSRESSGSDGDDYFAVFSFPAHGSEYLWDPTFMVQYATTSGDGGSANAMSAFWMDILGN